MEKLIDSAPWLDIVEDVIDTRAAACKAYHKAFDNWNKSQGADHSEGFSWDAASDAMQLIEENFIT